MVKRRSPETTSTESRRIEEFANQADGGGRENVNENAPRNYKKINVPFNQYEFERLEEAAEKAGRAKLNFIRWAIKKAIED